MKELETLRNDSVARYNIFASPIGPQIFLEPENGAGQDQPPADPPKSDEPPAEPPKQDEPPADAKEGEKSKLTDREAELLKDVMKTKERLKEAEKTANDANERLKAYEGIDPEKVKKLIADAEKAEAEKREAEKKAAESAGDFERVKQMMAEEHDKVLEAINGEKATLQAEIEKQAKLINDLTVGNAFSTSPFVSEKLVLTPTKARQLYGSHFEIEEGQVVAYDKPAGAAERTKLVDGRGNALGFEDAIQKIIEADPDRNRLVKSQLAPGAQSKTEGAKVQEKAGETHGVSRIAAALTRMRAPK